MALLEDKCKSCHDEVIQIHAKFCSTELKMFTNFHILIELILYISQIHIIKWTCTVFSKISSDGISIYWFNINHELVSIIKHSLIILSKKNLVLKISVTFLRKVF